MRARKGPPTRADYERLKSECRRLRAEMDCIRETMRRQRQELQTQFTRIAEMQTTLNEEHRATVLPRDSGPLMPRREVTLLPTHVG